MRNRIQPYDSTFSRYRTDGFTLHKDGVAAKVALEAGRTGLRRPQGRLLGRIQPDRFGEGY